jgi:hypothetical protein
VTSSPWSFEQRGEDPERLMLQANAESALAQLARAKVDLEYSEADRLSYA